MQLRIGATTLSTSILAILLLCTSGVSQPAGDTRRADEQEVFAAVIRTQMEDWYKSGDKNEAEAKTKTDREVSKRLNFPIFFVSINGTDPSDEFINRFRNIPRSIRKLSSAKPEKGPHTPADLTTGIQGIIFDAGKIRWLSKDAAEVEGGYYCGGLCAANNTFQVRRENGDWVVKGSRMNWIS
jgi:hypothetical protein